MANLVAEIILSGFPVMSATQEACERTFDLLECTQSKPQVKTVVLL